jgi:hypothetical protein
MFELLLVAMFASQIPNYSVEKICRSDAELAQDEFGLNACVQDEKAAKEKIAKEWSTYPASAKQECIPDVVMSGALGQSYVELMTCFEIQDWKKHLNDIGGRVGGGTVGGSPPTSEQVGGGFATHPLGGGLATHPLGGNPAHIH